MIFKNFIMIRLVIIKTCLIDKIENCIFPGNHIMRQIKWIKFTLEGEYLIEINCISSRFRNRRAHKSMSTKVLNGVLALSHTYIPSRSKFVILQKGNNILIELVSRIFGYFNLLSSHNLLLSNTLFWGQ